ncbi:MAG: Rieske 2Fe-2S domain-containing protein [Propionibacteriales bacterium]|nr:Rieske 2Fe-2S domain-containing protein [Propionibacteriales bacterium]
MSDLNRRTVLRGVAATGAIGAVGSLLAGCGSEEEPGSGGSTGDSTGGSTAEEPSESPTEGGGGGEALGATSDVPVGGGAVFKDQEIVVTQPTAGDFLAFSAICTHQGCVVEEVADGTINCGCHGSKYSIEDGSVVGGPAPEPLAEEKVTVEGDQITLG